jgi:hypothetical protein
VEVRKVLTAFIASPGDLEEERRAAFAVVDRINRVTARTLGWVVDLRGWEDVLPGFSRPQELINRDVDDCDIFIGMLWRRWGSPTGTHSSGFEEEFERARERHALTGTPDVWLYFKSVPGVETRDPGPQLARVLEFQAHAEFEKMLLFRRFESVSDWERQLFDALMTRVLNEARAEPVPEVSSEEQRLLAALDLLPPRVRLLDLYGDPDVTPERIVDRWRQADYASSGSMLLGLATSGPLRYHLDTDGPGVLVAGTTGSGKSVLFESIILSLSLQAPPELLRFVLIDWRGGWSFHDLPSLPAVDRLVTDPEEIAETVEWLSSLLSERERLLASTHAKDAPEFHALNVGEVVAMPRLVIVLDEFAALARDRPDVLTGLTSVAQRGRALGVHLIAGTQRPAGLVGSVRSNTNLRIALRVLDAADSVDVLGVPFAALLDRQFPGRAIGRAGYGSPIVFQTGTVGWTRREGTEVDDRAYLVRCLCDATRLWESSNQSHAAQSEPRA